MVKFIKVSNSIYILFPKRGIATNANVTFIRDPNTGNISFIDSGSALDPGIRLIKRVLKQINPIFKDSKLVITHGHLDHCHAAGHLKREFNTKIFGHENLHLENISAVIQGESVFGDYGEIVNSLIERNPNMINYGYYIYSTLFYGRGIKSKLDVKLKENDYIDVPPYNFRVIYTPGHSDDSIVLYDEKKKIIFLGDFIPWTPYPDSTISDFRKSIDKIIDLDIKLAIRGHGYPYKWDRQKEDFLSFLQDMDKAESRIIRCLKIRPMTLIELSRSVYERSHFRHNLIYTILMKMTLYWTKKYVEELLNKKLIEVLGKNNKSDTLYTIK